MDACLRRHDGVWKTYCPCSAMAVVTTAAGGEGHQNVFDAPYRCDEGGEEEQCNQHLHQWVGGVELIEHIGGDGVIVHGGILL